MISALLNLRVRASGGIEVRQSTDYQISIADRRRRPSVLGGGGSAGVEILTVKITGFTAGAYKFRVKKLDDAGNVTGDPFEVFAFSKGPSSNNVGVHDVTYCVPNYIVGDFIRIARMRVWTGEALVDDWWTLDTLHYSPCTVT